jgi:hypothetical protein
MTRYKRGLHLTTVPPSTDLFLKKREGRNLGLFSALGCAKHEYGIYENGGRE